MEVMRLGMWNLNTAMRARYSTHQDFKQKS